jgi:hypothetical protein
MKKTTRNCGWIFIVPIGPRGGGLVNRIDGELGV